MIGTVRVAVTMARMALHIVLGLCMVALAFPLRSASDRRRMIRWWSRRVLKICRLRVRLIEPEPVHARREAGDRTKGVIAGLLRVDGGGAMLVTNHVSWLDIFVIHSLRPARFIAKAEIARWPLLGFLVSRTGAIFIERGKRHAVREVNQRAAASLQSGELIGMFPEGGVSDGERLLPFHANLIQPAIDAGAPIVVAGLRYRDGRGRPTRATDYAGDVTLLQSLVRIARHGALVADLHLITVLDGGSTTRHEAARAARAAIADALGFDDEAQEVAEGLSTVIVIPEDPLTRDSLMAGMRPGTLLDQRDELL